MDDLANVLNFLDDKIAGLQAKLDGLKLARAALADDLPVRKALPAPAASPDPPKAKKRQLPDDVSSKSTLEPDALLDGMPLFLTNPERKIWDILHEAEDGVYIHMDVLMREVETTKATIYGALGTIKRKIAQTNYSIETKRGEGFILCHYGVKGDA